MGFQVKRTKTGFQTKGTETDGGFMQKRWQIVTRDAAIVVGLANLVGLVGFLDVFANADQMRLILYVITFISTSLGFFIVGYLTKTNRFKHLFIVAIEAWAITSLMNIYFLGYPAVLTFISIPAFLFYMLVGGGLSSIFVRIQQQPK